MKKSLLFLILILVMPTIVLAESWWDGDWQYRREINLTNNEDIDRIDDTVIVTDLQNYFQNAQGDYDDLRVIENGNEIAYEFFDSNTKLRFVTDVLANSQKIIYIYYNNQNATQPDYSNCAIWQPCTPLFEYTKLQLWFQIEDERTDILDYSGDNVGSLHNVEIVSDGQNDNYSTGYSGGNCYLDSNLIDNFRGTGWSIIGWYLAETQNGANGFFGSWNGDANSGWGSRTMGVDTMAIIMDGGLLFQTEGLEISDGTWHQIVLTFDSSVNEWKIYHDGQWTGDSGIGLYTLPENSIMFGNKDRVSNSCWVGLADNFRFYSKTLTEFSQEELFLGIGRETEIGDDFQTDLEILPEDILFSNENPLVNTTLTITAFFRNLLETDPDEILIRFYNGTPSNETFIGEDLVIVRGRSTFFSQIDYTLTTGGDYQDIYVVLDPEGEIEEGNENNNIAYKQLHVRTKPDLRIRDQDIGFSNNNPLYLEEIQIFAMIRNLQNEPSGEFTVKFYDSVGYYNIPIGEINLSIEGSQTEIAMISWTATPPGEHNIHIHVDSENVVDEWDEANNLASRSISVFRPSTTVKVYPLEI
jgi:hypothetical protein